VLTGDFSDVAGDAATWVHIVSLDLRRVVEQNASGRLKLLQNPRSVGRARKAKKKRVSAATRRKLAAKLKAYWAAKKAVKKAAKKAGKK
jgi:hypothetical protein